MSTRIRQQIIQLSEQVAQLNEQRRYEQAISSASRACDLALRHLGPMNPDTGQCLSNLAALYEATGHYGSAEASYRLAIEVYRTALGEQHPDFASSLNNLAALYHSMGNYDEAEPRYLQATEVYRIALGEQHPDFASSLSSLGVLYWSMGKNVSAESLFLRAIEIYRIALGEQHPDFASSLNNLAALYYSMGNYDKAEPLYKQAVEIERTALGEQDPDFAASLNNLGALYESMGDYDKAEPLYRKAVDICRTALGEKHPRFATTVNNLAELYRVTGDYDKAETLHREALEIRRTALGDQHPDFAMSVNNLALLYKTMGDYRRAEPLYGQAMELYRNVFGEQNQNFAMSLNNLAELYRAMGDYRRAEPLLKQAMDINCSALGEQHPHFAQSLNNLGTLYEATGNYAGAELLLRQALLIRRELLGEQHSDFAQSVNNLAALYRAMGDYDRAVVFCKEAMEIRRKSLGEQHPLFAQAVNNLAVSYSLTGDYGSAESLLRQAMEILRVAVGEQHSNFAESLNNLAGLYDSIGNYGKAEPLLRQAIEVYRSAVGEHHPDFAQTINNLAALYLGLGNYGAAEPLLKQALEIYVSVSEHHPDIATTLKNLAALCAATGRDQEALRLMQQAASIADRLIGQIFAIGSETQRTALLEKVRVDFDVLLSLISQHLPDSTPAVRYGLDLILKRKAVAAEAMATQRDAVLGGNHPELEQELRALTILRMQIAQKTLAGPGPEGISAHRQLLAQWGSRKDVLEAELARRVPEMNIELNLRQADRRAVALAMPQESKLVEFARFDLADFKAVRARGESRWKAARYLAFILSAGEADDVQMIDLGEADPIDRMIATFRASVTGEDEGQARWNTLALSVESDAATILGIALREATIDPLAATLGSCRKLLISPDGDLTRLPFEVLPTVEGRRVIDDYHISYVSTGRDVLRFNATLSGGARDPLVLADPDFDLEDLSNVQQEALGHQTVNAEGAKTSLLPKALDAPKDLPSVTTAQPDGTGGNSRTSRLLRDLERDRLSFTRLKGTRAEGIQIARLLATQPLLDRLALEATVKTRRSPVILHIATHGFFLKDQQRDLDKGLLGLEAIGLQQGRLSGHGLENPLLRSGLVLAGANTWLKNGRLPAEAEDGILTAEDVTGMDLLATEMVVLSACETGLGEVRRGEGVLGLRRAFMLAGAKTLVMSLWKVPDDETRELMEDFYHRILAGQPRADALREAQLAMKKRYEDPYLWGAFICQGDPGPLRAFKTSSFGRQDLS